MNHFLATNSLRLFTIAIVLLFFSQFGYGQDSRTFLNTSTGRSGADTDNSSGTLGSDPTLSGGIYSWTVPTSGNYSIEAWGARGGGIGNTDFDASYRAGFGAKIKAEVNLTQGTVIKVLVGQMGTNGSNSAGGGGGGAFVVQDQTPILIAGGGGSSGSGGGWAGRYLNGYKDANLGVNGNNGENYSSYTNEVGVGGLNGQEGETKITSWNGYGGAGFFSDANSIDGSQSFLNGGIAAPGGNGGTGGFGGGGSSKSYGGAGGGGYSGGGSNGRHAPGGGGGSFIISTATNVQTSNGLFQSTNTFNGASITNLNSYNSGHGKVIITELSSGGTISSAISVFCTSSTDPDAFTSTAAANGGSGTFSYQWQVSTDNSNYTDIPGETALTYNPGEISQTTYYRRRATNSLTLYSNVLTLEKFEISSHPSTANQSLLPSATPTDLSVLVSNSTGVSYQWYKNASNSNVGGTSMGSSYRNLTFTPPTSTVSKWYYYVVVTKGGCSITSNVSGLVNVGNPISVIPQATDPWKPLIKLANFDPNDDQQSVKDNDLVGDATNAMLETQKATYNFSSGASNDEVYYFRVRMGASHKSGKLGTSFYLALDKDNDYIADVFVEANIKGERGKDPYVAFHISDPSEAGTGPSNTGWVNSSNNSNIERQLTSRDAFIKAYDADTDLDNDETDTWIEFAFTEESLKSFVSDALSSSIDGDSMFAIYTFTSTGQTANGDIGGIDDRTADLTKTWEELGIVIKGSLNEITTNAILAPSVKEETFSSLTPTITGTWGNDQGGTDALAVAVNGVTYTTSGSDLTIDGYSWSLTIPNTLTAGTSYTVSATTTRSAESKTGTGTITILDNDSSLSNISFNNITLSPTFNSTTYAYAMSVGATVGSTTFSATTNSNVASMTINGVPTASMSNTLYNIPYGTSTVTIIVYAPDGSNTTYTIAITRSIIPTLSIVDGDATTDEDGDTAQISAVLPQAPTADVTLNFYVNDATEGTISPSSLTFTTSNWNTPQIITVTGIDDPISEGAVVRDGAQSYTITGTTTSSDTAYNGSTLPTQIITNQNTDPPGISVTTSGNTLSEDGGSITATFALLSNLSPTNATVTMTISLSDATEASFSASSIITSSVVTLTDSASSTSVTIYGVDDATVDGTQTVSLITGDPTSDLDTGTESYDALTASDIADVNLQTTDNDKVGDVYTDFGGFWSSGAGNINSTKPNTDHDLLGFDFGGKTYATGVDLTKTRSEFDRALSIEKANSYVEINSISDELATSQNFTFSMWINLPKNSTVNSPYVVAINGPSSDNNINEILMGFTSYNQLRLYDRGGNSYPSATS